MDLVVKHIEFRYDEIDFPSLLAFFIVFLIVDPLPSVSATMIYEFIAIVGADLLKIYGKQFHKVLQFMQSQYIEKLKEVDSIDSGKYSWPYSKIKYYCSRKIQTVMSLSRNNSQVGTPAQIL